MHTFSKMVTNARAKRERSSKMWGSQKARDAPRNPPKSYPRNPPRDHLGAPFHAPIYSLNHRREWWELVRTKDGKEYAVAIQSLEHARKLRLVHGGFVRKVWL
jgi:hypothetical protein